MFKGTINEVLFEIAKQLGLQWNDLVQYANEAPYAAGRPDGIPWPSGTGSVSEKRILYAIARAINPIVSLDLGTRWGAMALQILSGDKDAPPPAGKLISVDIEKTIHGSKTPVGKFIPKHGYNVELITANALQYLKNDNKVHEIIFEDTEHTYEMTKAIYELAPERLVPGGVIISHDACHPKFKGDVVKGIKTAGIEPMVYLVEGDSCGLAIWQKPKTDGLRWKKESAVMENLVDNAKADTKAPQEKPKRRKRKRKKASETVEKALDETVASVEEIGRDENHIYLKETPTDPEAL
jgi:predicted O-methyltransferase YrrM